MIIFQTARQYKKNPIFFARKTVGLTIFPLKRSPIFSQFIFPDENGLLCLGARACYTDKKDLKKPLWKEGTALFKPIQPALAQRWHAAADVRISARHCGGSPTEEEFAHLKTLCAQEEALAQEGVRIAFGRGAVFTRAIQGTEGFAAFFTKKNADARTDAALGWAGEALALECAAMGLGTCWIGASMKKSAVLSLCPAKKDEELRCILSIGRHEFDPAPVRNRKPFEKTAGLTEEAFSALPAWQKGALLCARQAPTAVNRQCWEARLSPEALAVRSTGRNFGFGQIDLGIVLLHLMLGAQAGGFHGGMMEMTPWFALAETSANFADERSAP